MKYLLSPYQVKVLVFLAVAVAAFAMCPLLFITWEEPTTLEEAASIEADGGHWVKAKPLCELHVVQVTNEFRCFACLGPTATDSSRGLPMQCHRWVDGNRPNMVWFKWRN